MERGGVTDAPLSLLLRQGRSHLLVPSLPPSYASTSIDTGDSFLLSSAGKTFNVEFTVNPFHRIVNVNILDAIHRLAMKRADFLDLET